ncbi:ComEA family DNA-binding protein [Neobacillus sp. K501]
MNKKTFWEVKNSLWILFTFTIVLNWVAFFVIGHKAKYKKWKMYGALYSFPFILFIIFDELFYVGEIPIGLALMVGWISSIIHAFRIRKEYLLRLEAVELAKPEEERRLRGKIESEYGVRLKQETASSQMNGQQIPVPQPSRKMVDSNPVQMVNSVPLDLNHASELELAELPGVGAILAKKAIKERANRGGFRSLEDFSQPLGLKPHIVERIRPLVVVTVPKEDQPQAWSGRMVDF